MAANFLYFFLCLFYCWWWWFLFGWLVLNRMSRNQAAKSTHDLKAANKNK